MGRGDVDYIGQTGMGTMTIRKRLRMLRGVYGELMPYRDPHTAGPALWALYHQTGEDSVAAPAAPSRSRVRGRGDGAVSR
jgi:hypothetical protein